MHFNELSITPVDSHLSVTYLKVPKSQVHSALVYFELYDGAGTVRTVTQPDSNSHDGGTTICVLISRGQEQLCREILLSLRDRIKWTALESVHDPFLINATD